MTHHVDENILIIGATSAIAQACARRWAEKNASLYLIGRQQEKLNAIAADLIVRGAKSVYVGLMDVNDFSQHPDALCQASKTLGGISVALIAHGDLGNQQVSERDFTQTLKDINTNAISVISILTWLANEMEAKHHGVIAVISSVAGDRGRQSNYIYGSAKGAVTIFLQGLRNRLFHAGVHVLTIKPGFVDTPMTAHLKKGILWVTADKVARDILKAIKTKRNVIYSPFFWRFIMLAIIHVPEMLFKKLKL